MQKCPTQAQTLQIKEDPLEKTNKKQKTRRIGFIGHHYKYTRLFNACNFDFVKKHGVEGRHMTRNNL